MKPFTPSNLLSLLQLYNDNVIGFNELLERLNQIAELYYYKINN